MSFFLGGHPALPFPLALGRAALECVEFLGAACFPDGCAASAARKQGNEKEGVLHAYWCRWLLTPQH